MPTLKRVSGKTSSYSAVWGTVCRYVVAWACLCGGWWISHAWSEEALTVYHISLDL